MTSFIREAALPDAEGIGVVHVSVWNDTYRGIMPDRVLDAMSVAERAEAWRKRMSEIGQGGLFGIFVAEENKEIVGFSACGVQRDEKMAALGFPAEFMVINLARKAQGRGLGRRLMASMAKRILTNGHDAASLWAVRDNPAANGFYKRLGGEPVGEKIDMRLDLALAETAYGWRDLRHLADSA